MGYNRLNDVITNYLHLGKLILKCPDGSVATFQPLHSLPEFVYRIPYLTLTEGHDTLICYVAPLRVADIIQICPYPGLPFEVSDGDNTWKPSSRDMAKLVSGVRKMHNTIILFLKGDQKKNEKIMLRNPGGEL